MACCDGTVPIFVSHVLRPRGGNSQSRAHGVIQVSHLEQALERCLVREHRTPRVDIHSRPQLLASRLRAESQGHHAHVPDEVLVEFAQLALICTHHQ